MSTEGMDSPTDKLSPYGKQLLKTLGGDPRYLGLTAAQVTRWSLERPESVLNLVADDDLALAAANLPSEIVAKTEPELAAEFVVSRVDRRVRISFWEAYENAAKNLRPFVLDEIMQGSGVGSMSEYKQRLLTTPTLLAWLLCPPAGYKLQMKEALDLGLKRLMDILELPVVDPLTKKVSPAIAALHLQAFRLIDQRVNGAITQKIVSIGASAGHVPDGADQVDHRKLDEKLAELERLLQGTALAAPPPAGGIIDVTPEP